LTQAAAGEPVVGAPAGWVAGGLVSLGSSAVPAGWAVVAGWPAPAGAALPVHPAVTAQVTAAAHAAAYARHRLLARCTPRL
jgi:hypothetical protein